jgi:hypothetical protein
MKNQTGISTRLYILIVNNIDSYGAYGPYSKYETFNKMEILKRDIENKGWRVFEIKSETDPPSFLCYRDRQTIIVEAYPEEEREPAFWDKCLELTKQYGPLYL